MEKCLLKCVPLIFKYSLPSKIGWDFLGDLARLVTGKFLSLISIM